MPLSKIQTILDQLVVEIFLINGDMQVFSKKHLRGNLGGGYDTVDRWRSSQNSSGLGNYESKQSTDTPNGFGFSV